MNVVINFTIEIDVTAYALEYGLTVKEAIKRIKQHIRDAGTAELIDLGFIKQIDPTY